MNFIGIGPAELIVILVVALIFVGPERLPRLAADLARTIREIRKYTSSIAAEFTEVIQEFENETAGDRSQWKEIGEGLTDATRSVTEAIRGARADAEAAPAIAPAAAPEAAAGASANGAAAADGAWREIAEPPAAAEPGAPSTNGAAPSQPAEEAR
jgi:sec-independent protein translocase protein TatB